MKDPIDQPALAQSGPKRLKVKVRVKVRLKRRPQGSVVTTAANSSLSPSLGVT
jgi:hypothetical protein